MTTTTDGRPKCDLCEKAATVNYQTGTARYTIDETGYRFDELFTDDMVNEHWCDEHDEAQGTD